MKLYEELLCSKFIKHTNDFQCVDKDEDDQVQLFLQEQALELMERNLVRTRLVFDESQNLVGFYSLFNDTIKMNKQKREEIDVYHSPNELQKYRP